jgi:DNA-binding NtrC family response regulator
MTNNRAMLSHQQDIELENILFLVDDCRLHPDLAAKRLGLTRNTLDKKLERAAREQSHPGAVAYLGRRAAGEEMPEMRDAG